MQIKKTEKVTLYRSKWPDRFYRDVNRKTNEKICHLFRYCLGGSMFILNGLKAVDSKDIRTNSAVFVGTKTSPLPSHYIEHLGRVSLMPEKLTNDYADGKPSVFYDGFKIGLIGEPLSLMVVNPFIIEFKRRNR